MLTQSRISADYSLFAGDYISKMPVCQAGPQKVYKRFDICCLLLYDNGQILRNKGR